MKYLIFLALLICISVTLTTTDVEVSEKDKSSGTKELSVCPGKINKFTPSDSSIFFDGCIKLSQHYKFI